LVPDTSITLPLTAVVLVLSTKRATRSGLVVTPLTGTLVLLATKRIRSVGARKTALLSSRSAASLVQPLPLLYS
jgi:hypothetical protein